MATRSSTGLNKNTSAALAYVLGPITGIIFLILEKDAYVRFHSMQSIVTFIGLFILQVGIGALAFILLPLVRLVNLVTIVGFILWLVLIYKAWQGEEWEVPFFGKFARQLVNRA